MFKATDAVKVMPTTRENCAELATHIGSCLSVLRYDRLGYKLTIEFAAIQPRQHSGRNHDAALKFLLAKRKVGKITNQAMNLQTQM